MQYTDTQLLARVSALDTFKGFTGMIDIWIRSKADHFNLFDDKVYTFDCRGDKPQFLRVCTGTTNAGRYGLEHFDRYNREGCAVLASDIIVYNSHRYGLHKGQYPAYVQDRVFPFYRDNNKNERAEEIGNVHDNEIIGANCHHAGVDSTLIENWSVACLVRNVRKQYDKWLEAMHKEPLTVAILKEF